MPTSNDKRKKKGGKKLQRAQAQQQASPSLQAMLKSDDGDDDGEQELRRLQNSMPPGVNASVAAVYRRWEATVESNFPRWIKTNRECHKAEQAEDWNRLLVLADNWIKDMRQKQVEAYGGDVEGLPERMCTISCELDAYDYRGEARYELGMYQEAIPDLTEAFQLAELLVDRHATAWGIVDDKVRILLRRAKTYEILGDFEKAFVDADACVALTRLDFWRQVGRAGVLPCPLRRPLAFDSVEQERLLSSSV